MTIQVQKDVDELMKHGTYSKSLEEEEVLRSNC